MLTTNTNLFQYPAFIYFINIIKIEFFILKIFLILFMATIIECLICWSNIEQEEITLPCNHSFHNGCFELWQKYNNTCPYCRYNLEDDAIIPQTLFDEIIEQDGNIDKLTEDNYYKFYRLNENIFPHDYVLQNIAKIKNTQKLKLSLILGHKYEIIGNYINKIGILIKINQIRFDGTFSCWLINNNETIVFLNNLHSIIPLSSS